MGNLFHGPTPWILLFVVLLLFGAPKLPALARSLGQSMKILKKEVTGDGEEDGKSAAAPVNAQAAPQAPAQPETPAAPQAPAQQTPPAPPAQAPAAPAPGAADKPEQ